ncbi:DEHA2B01188p [Debaryomyces hansenii CBS767]|uniref:DEHA2B01188p n=1 Tax=Debaryomyces hansenii (strain ATCC 36239 / CBS 767 / BCRC 21394 / JCM 1990 / NBRC 0083 / IGC 2968) TaxID=284592 RepID=Q6BXQ1_DEBHA|nr:DEHA2B01188p [Debaryomyces hansenii CBS767]CAG85003.2 DEHA2B01188p [Debaryomyces hansenii CBS767]|eukprot:XP_457018.2 DEHA2B01188p [Debaryomyces hansenii CBS767]
MGVWGEDGCTGIPMSIYTQPGCIPVDGRLVMSFALIKLTSVLEIIDLRAAAMTKNTVVIARNCSSNKY